MVRPGLDLIELMIRQGMEPSGSLPASALTQDKWASSDGHAIEVRVYGENANNGFQPAPGALSEVSWGDVGERGRIETWVSSGTVVTPFYDPMLCKLCVWAPTRAQCIEKTINVLKGSEVS